MATLTNKQQAFVDAYLGCLNGAEAARRVSPRAKRPDQIAYEYLRKPEIAEAIRAGLTKRAMASEEVLARLSEHARADVRDLFTFDEAGQIAGLNLSRSAPLHLIKSITPTKYGTKIELHDAQAALGQLGRHHGLFVDKIAPTDPTGQKEYADTTLNALRDRLIAQLTAGAAGSGAGGVPPGPDSDRDGGVAL